MARPTSRHSNPGRTLLILLALILALGGTMLLQKAFTPKLGLDLAGGTTVTLSPVTLSGAAPSQESLDRAVSIIRDRVNGTGISDAEVAKSGDNIIISVPGKGQEEVIKLVGTTAELRFRQVLAVEAAAPEQLTTEAPKPSSSPSGTTAPSKEPSAKPTAGAPKETPKATPTGKALSSALTSPTTPTPSAKDDKKKDSKATPTPSGSPSAQPSQPQQEQQPQIDTSGVDPAVLKQYQGLNCTDPKTRGQGVQDDPKKQFAACSDDGSAKYILDVAKVVGTDIDTATAGVRPGSTDWVVQLDFKSAGASEWSKLTSVAFNSQPPRSQVAVVLDGLVITAPVIQGPIPGGRAEITGGFNQKSATDLADQLKYGALPLKFNRSSVETISSTLGSDQLMGGLIAGAIGLGLVVLYCLLYYRGLGLVAVLSLVVATVLTYQSVVVLGANGGFALSLPHIIGLVVSIGITADSFIVYFERIRDEMKEGRRTLRAAVEVAWVRARRTILIADAVMFIAAVVLYFLAVGGVAGFAFAMGLTTLIDIVVVFLFTKPFIALLARLKFFAKGHPLSGLDAERMAAEPARSNTPQEA
ncbi:protein translocase subunit SecD [Nonomuraea sp. NPDC050790]|uniref:protein translocase subunit SecD n=1 Tax=Nonomuraea sp. NPDC050790 TaxID=3364371 RepID=UPI00378F2866